MNKLVIIILILSFFVGGCATAQTVFYDDNKPVYPPTQPEEIKIFHSNPPQPFIRIGEVTVNSSKTFYQKRLKEKAAGMGGHAIILAITKDPPTAFFNTEANFSYGVSAGRTIGVVIRFPEKEQ